MKKNFQFNLIPNDLFKQIIPYQVGMLFLLISFYVLYFAGLFSVKSNPSGGAILILIAIIVLIPLIILSLIYSIVILKNVMPAYSYDNNKFDFKGETGKYLGINVSGILLTIITLGIYMAWYYAKSYKFIVEETYYKDKNFIFTGKGGKLFVIILLTFAVPLIILSIILGLIIIFFSLSGNTASLSMIVPVIMVLFYLVIIIITIPYVYKISEWFYNNIKYEDKSIHWNTKFFASCFFILGQTALCLITCGIYYFAAAVKINKYFTDKTEIINDQGKVTGKFEFQGRTMDGFVLLLVNSLILMVTLGVYTPWYYAKVNKWFAENTYLDELE